MEEHWFEAAYCPAIRRKWRMGKGKSRDIMEFLAVKLCIKCGHRGQTTTQICFKTKSMDSVKSAKSSTLASDSSVDTLAY